MWCAGGAWTFGAKSRRARRQPARAHPGQAAGGTRFSPPPGGARSTRSPIPRLGKRSKNVAVTVAEALPARARAKPLDAGFQDAARTGWRGTLTRIWAPRGTRPRAPRDMRHTRASIFGAVCAPRAAPPPRGSCPLADAHGPTRRPGMPIAPGLPHRRVSAHMPSACATAPAGLGPGAASSRTKWLSLPPYRPELNPVVNLGEDRRHNNLGIRPLV
jgi:hypothetical protein